MTSVSTAGSLPSESGYSSSAQIIWRLPVAASITTAGWSASKDRAGSVMGTRPVASNAAWLSRPGTFVTISDPGLKPSLRLISVGSIGLPAMFLGISVSWRFSRRPVSVVGSGLVNSSLGHGYRHADVSLRSHACAAAAGSATSASRSPRMSRRQRDPMPPQRSPCDELAQVRPPGGVSESMGERDWNDVPEHLDGKALEWHLSRRDFIRRAAYTAGIGLSIASGMPASQVLAKAVKKNRIAVPVGANNPIDHFVILMMENRSFDHYFGWLDPSIANASQHQSYTDPSGKQFQTRHAPDILGAQAQWQGCGFGDPGHGWDQGRAQLKGGFLADGSGNDEFALAYYDEGELGFIHPAAKAFTLYDNYFCSLLGPTWPNRYYKWSAQSGGRKDNSPPVQTAGNQWNTIFDVALAANPGQVPGMGPPPRYYNSALPFSAVWGARAVPWTRPA